MIDVSQKTIQKIFYEKIRERSIGRIDTFDFQFSDDWMISDEYLN